MGKWLILRKTFRLGPFHFNLSWSGLGVSVGRRGLRIGRTAKGEGYVAGSRKGVSIKKYKKL